MLLTLFQDLAHFLSSSSATEPVPDFDSEFQWIPADVEVDIEGKTRFTSYVNNLNPWEFEEMYGVLEEILSTTFIPLWDKLLTHISQDRNGEAIISLRGRKIQVVVRMTSTHLTQEHPKHPGDTDYSRISINVNYIVTTQVDYIFIQKGPDGSGLMWAYVGRIGGRQVEIL